MSERLNIAREVAALKRMAEVGFDRPAVCRLGYQDIRTRGPVLGPTRF